MSGLYVPLDVEYASDDKIMRVGPLAELLYVRGLAFCKRTMSDGVISREQLTIVARGIGKPNWQAAQLVQEGLWNATGTGWEVVGWHRRNKSKQAIESDKEARRNASQKANHDRWHSSDQGKPSLSCPLCYPISDKQSDTNRTDSVSDSDPTSDSHKPEPEGSQRESQSQREREGLNGSSSVEKRVCPSRVTETEPRSLAANLAQLLGETR
jgi:hypothetical protein